MAVTCGLTRIPRILRNGVCVSIRQRSFPTTAQVEKFSKTIYLGTLDFINFSDGVYAESSDGSGHSTNYIKIIYIL